MKSYKGVLLSRLLATVGLVGFFCLLALTCAVHFHTPTVDHTQSECPLCLISAPSKVFVAPLGPCLSTSQWVSLSGWPGPGSCLCRCGRMLPVVPRRLSPSFLSLVSLSDQ